MHCNNSKSPTVRIYGKFSIYCPYIYNGLFSMYYDIFLKSWKTKENLDPIPAKSLWTRSGRYFVIIITRTAPRRPTAIGSFVISNSFGSKKHPRDTAKIEIGVGPSSEYSVDLLSASYWSLKGWFRPQNGGSKPQIITYLELFPCHLRHLAWSDPRTQTFAYFSFVKRDALKFLRI